MSFTLTLALFLEMYGYSCFDGLVDDTKWIVLVFLTACDKALTSENEICLLLIPEGI